MMGKQDDGQAFVTNISHPQQVPEVWEAVIEKMRRHQFPQSDIFGVQLALEEALTNAINHGHQHDYSKEVAVEWTVDDDVVRLSIEDQGNGFLCDEVCDPTHPENFHQPGGRGLLFMRTYMCSVEYNEKGNRVTMVKNRTRDKVTASQQS